MKLLIIISIYVIFSCEQASENNNSELRVYETLSDIKINEGQRSLELDLSKLFLTKAGRSEGIEIELLTISNPNLFEAEINDKRLIITFILTKTGQSSVTLIAKYNSEELEYTFKVLIEKNRTLLFLENAMDLLRNGHYTTAKQQFSYAATLDDERYVQRAWLGLAYVEYKLDDFANSYLHANYGIGLKSEKYDRDFRIIKTLLERDYKKNDVGIISSALSLFEKVSFFNFYFDRSINEKDLRLILVKSLFKIEDYENCLIHIRKIAPTFSLENDDVHYLSKLSDEIERLSNLHLNI